MRLDVIMPVLDEAARLEAALGRLADAAFDRVIVVDGGSLDASFDIAARSGATTLRTATGRARQLNAGARASTAEALVFVHADATLPRGARAAIEGALRSGAVGGAFRIRTVADGPRRVPSALLRVADLRSRWTRLPYGDQVQFVWREVFEAVGGFPDQPIFEDLELSRRLRRLGRVEVVQDEVRVSSRRFESRPLYYAAAMTLLPLLYRAGVAPETLAAWYGPER